MLQHRAAHHAVVLVVQIVAQLFVTAFLFAPATRRRHGHDRRYRHRRRLRPGVIPHRVAPLFLSTAAPAVRASRENPLATSVASRHGGRGREVPSALRNGSARPQRSFRFLFRSALSTIASQLRSAAEAADDNFPFRALEQLRLSAFGSTSNEIRTRLPLLGQARGIGAVRVASHSRSSPSPLASWRPACGPRPPFRLMEPASIAWRPSDGARC